MTLSAPDGATKWLYSDCNQRFHDCSFVTQIKSYTPCQKNTFKSAVVLFEKTDLCLNIIETYWSLRNLSFSLSGRCAKKKEKPNFAFMSHLGAGVLKNNKMNSTFLRNYKKYLNGSGIKIKVTFQRIL